MFIAFNGNNLVVGASNGEKISAESTFYYKLSKLLSILGLDCIRKEMAKDGHLVDDGRFYSVDRKRHFAFYQTDWATYDVCKDYFNKSKPIPLAIDTFDEIGVSIMKDATKKFMTEKFKETISKKLYEKYGANIVSFGVLPENLGYGKNTTYLDVRADYLGSGFPLIVQAK